MTNTFKLFLTLTLFHVLMFSTFAATLRVENFVDIKGQEKSKIFGWGLVTGLPGTGDDPKAYTPAAHAILRQFANTGMAGSDVKGISSGKNTALVQVTVTIPATGARDGEVLDCTISSPGGAKSLAGGILSPAILGTSLKQDENSVVLGMAQGRVTIEDTATPTVGRVVDGCRLLADFTNPYIKDGLVTLIVKKELARPKLALRIAEEINGNPEFEEFLIPLATAIGTNQIAVRIPRKFYGNPMDFIAIVLDAEVMDAPQAVPRITINERAGTIAINENVEVKPTLVNHKNMIVETAPAPGDPDPDGQRQFVDVDTDAKFRQMNGETVDQRKLKSLQAVLDAIKVTPEDMIDIIKILHAQGAIVGEVVFVD